MNATTGLPAADRRSGPGAWSGSKARSPVSAATAASAATSPGRSRARSVTSRPISKARGTCGSASTAACHPARAILAASGSQWMFHSVVGVVLPGTRNAPPIAIQRFRSWGRRGSMSTATARLVRGPSVTSVISPGRRRASATMRSGAYRPDSDADGSGSSA